MANKRLSSGPDPIGLVGLGLMGRGIAACLIAHGFKVCAYNRTHERVHQARAHIGTALRDLARRRIIPHSRLKNWEDRFSFVRSPHELAHCPFIIESLREELKLKSDIFDQLENVAAPEAVIASNTSSLPITLLQKGRKHPERFIVMHWAEPAWITRFMEIVRNKATSDRTLELTRAVAEACDKEPSVLNFDIRGFLTNRMMYAFIREACYLVDSGVASVEDIDRSFRNDVGWWAAIAGPFRWMDLTGIHSYGQVMEGLLPDLTNRRTLPRIMKKMMENGAQGIANQKASIPTLSAAPKPGRRHGSSLPSTCASSSSSMSAGCERNAESRLTSQPLSPPLADPHSLQAAFGCANSRSITIQRRLPQPMHARRHVTIQPVTTQRDTYNSPT